MPHPYRLRTSAGPSVGNLTPIPANTCEKNVIAAENATVHLTLHIQNLRSSSPTTASPSTSPYFTRKNHTGDLYALCITFIPRKKPIQGDALVWGNHFSHPIRDSLPLAFPLLFSAAKWIDPSLQADVYADEPWIHGPALASMSTISCAPAGAEEEVGGLEEDNGLGLTSKARRKRFLNEGKRKEWVFGVGKEYKMEFSGPWLDFGEFRVVLPGFRVDILKYWDGQPLRFLLKNRESGEVYLVVEFELVEAGEGEEGDGSDGRSTSSGEEVD